jgi:hypothetical protein
MNGQTCPVRWSGERPVIVKSVSGLNDDFIDILRALQDSSVQYLVVGAHSMAVHGVPRATGDLDLWVNPDEFNAKRVMDALRLFGAPIEAHGVTPEDFTVEGTVYQMGLPPRRIDVLTSISGVHFDHAWATRTEVVIDGMTIPFLGLKALAANKRAAGRDKDLVDLRLLNLADPVGEGPPSDE